MKHELIHRVMGRELTPACTCGWWSGNRSHADFERHLKKHTPSDDDVREQLEYLLSANRQAVLQWMQELSVNQATVEDMATEPHWKDGDEPDPWSGG